MEELLRQADVVSLHVPLNPHTQHLLNAERLGMMKPGAILVNTSRGAVVDSLALLDMLNEGKLAGAALDVLEGERVISEDFILSHGIGKGDLDKLRLAVEAYQLMHHPKVLVTPHIAFYSREALQRILRTTVENVMAFEGGAAVNVAV
ncbi:MAG: NAD(P)-dependent oxidoreductase [Armatimonadia bacterium]